MAKQIIRPIELPTQHARDIAIASKLSEPESEVENVNEWERQENKLAMFQQMSVHSDLAQCLSIYGNDKITKKQQDALAEIHKHTKDWIVGHVTGELLKRLSDGRTGAKDANDIATTILEATLTDEQKGKQKAIGRLVRFAEAAGDKGGN
jgi:hypothetical protein